MNKTPEIGYVNHIISRENLNEALRRNIIRYFKALNPKFNPSLKSSKIMIEKQMVIELDDTNYRGLTFDYLDDIMYIDLDIIRRDFEEDFLVHLCDTISHETIHLVLRKLDGLKACKQYDNIYRRLRISGYSGC